MVDLLERFCSGFAAGDANAVMATCDMTDELTVVTSEQLVLRGANEFIRVPRPIHPGSDSLRVDVGPFGRGYPWQCGLVARHGLPNREYSGRHCVASLHDDHGRHSETGPLDPCPGARFLSAGLRADEGHSSGCVSRRARGTAERLRGICGQMVDDRRAKAAPAQVRVRLVYIRGSR